MKKILIVGIIAFAMIASAGLASASITINGSGAGYFKAETHLAGGESTLDDRVEINAWYWDIDMDINQGSYNIERTVSIPSTHGSPYFDRNYLKGKTSWVEYETRYAGSEDITVYGGISITGTTHDYSGGSLQQTYASGESVFSQMTADISRSDRNFATGFNGTTDTGDYFDYGFSHTRSGNRRFLDVAEFSASDPAHDFSGFGAGGDLTVYGIADFTFDVKGTIAGDSNSANPDRSTRQMGAIGYFAPASDYTGTEIDYSGWLYDMNFGDIPDSNSDTSTRERYPKLEDMFGFTVGYFGQI